MVVVPGAFNVARPLVPETLLMVAAVRFDEDQVTELVMSGPFAPFVAVNCRDPAPWAIVWFSGLITMLVIAPQTVTLARPLIPWEVAVMLAVPGETPVTRPVLEFTVAVAGTDDDQLALTLPVEPSLKVPVATICKAEPTLTNVLPLAAPTVMAVKVGLTKNPEQPASKSNTIPAIAYPN